MEGQLTKIAPYNLWGGNVLPTGYSRKEYEDLDALIDQLINNP